MTTAALVGVQKSFGSRAILRDVTYEFASARRFFITGPSGCGKTTVLNILAGYVTPDAGTVTVPDQRAYLLQEEMLFAGLTVRQNLLLALSALGSAAAPPAIDEALEKMRMTAAADQPVSQLSGGERQRVQLARIFLSAPSLVLLDEPTAHLDEENEQVVADLIESAFADASVIVVGHDTRSPLAHGAVVLALRCGGLRDA